MAVIADDVDLRPVWQVTEKGTNAKLIPCNSILWKSPDLRN